METLVGCAAATVLSFMAAAMGAVAHNDAMGPGDSAWKWFLLSVGCGLVTYALGYTMGAS